MGKLSYTVGPENKLKRLDSFVSSKSGLSRSYVQKLIQQGLLIVNIRAEKASYKVKDGDRIEVTFPEESPSMLNPEEILLDVIWEDEYIIVINKVPGMVVYPAAGHKSGTLLNALIFRCGKLASTGAPLRSGVVHRLDRDTSGLIVFAKNDMAYANLVRQFSERKVEKHYLALLYGKLKTDRGEINAAIGRSVSDRKKMSTKTRKGKEAVTQFEVIEKFKSATLAKVKIITGRTHQIRVHFADSGHPVLGDKTYGKKTTINFGQKKTLSFGRQMLHAFNLKFKHPLNGRPLEFTAPLPGDMKKAIEELSDGLPEN